MYFIWIKWWQGLSASPELPSWICFALGFSSCCLNVRVLLSAESGIFAFWGHFLLWFRLHICSRQGNSRFIYSDSLVLFSHRLTLFDQFNNRLCANKQDNTPKIYCSFPRHVNGEFPASQTEMSDGPKQSFWIQMSCVSFNCRQVRCEFWSRWPPVSPKKQTELTDLSLCLSCPPDVLITTEWRQDFNLPCRCFGIFVKPFLQWTDLFLVADLPLSPVWPCAVPSCIQRVVADLTLEDRTCLNLLFSSCMLGDLGLARWRPPRLFSPFTPPSARNTCNTDNAVMHWNKPRSVTGSGYFKAACTCFATCGQQNMLQAQYWYITGWSLEESVIRNYDRQLFEEL